MAVKRSRITKSLYGISLICREEASIYSNIGTGKLYEMTEKPDCPFVLWVGSRRIIKRKVFEEYIAKQYSI